MPEILFSIILKLSFKKISCSSNFAFASDLKKNKSSSIKYVKKNRITVVIKLIIPIITLCKSNLDDAFIINMKIPIKSEVVTKLAAINVMFLFSSFSVQR